MRVVNWIVVIISVAWLILFNLVPGISDISLSHVELDQVTGTVTAATHTNSLDSHHEFADRYTQAWNSHDPSRVGEFFTSDCSFTINDGEPYRGTAGLVAMAEEFMMEFPDMDKTMNGLEALDGRLVYHWTVTGTHAQTGNPVRIHGTETWRLDSNGLIAESTDLFDAAEYDRQVAGEPAH